jgi:transposase
VRLADELGTLFTDELFQRLYPTHGQPALAPWRLALVTLLQFAEGLSDRQAVSAVRSRIDWKYVLRLELDDPGFDASVLCEFRARLLAGEAEQVLLETLLAWCRERQLLKAGGRQRTDSTHVWAAVRGLNRLALVIEAMRHALNSLAVAAPTWFQVQADPTWVERYSRRAEQERLPTKAAAQAALALAVGADGYHLLDALYAAQDSLWLREIPAVAILRQVWIQNYTRIDDAVQWREKNALPPAAQFINSPDDPDAHLAARRTMHWVGYKVHFTETCDDGLPPLIIHAATTAAPIADGDLTPTLHAALLEQDMLPKEHVVDTGYLDAALLVRSRIDYGVDLIGPTRSD